MIPKYFISLVVVSLLIF